MIETPSPVDSSSVTDKRDKSELQSAAADPREFLSIGHVHDLRICATLKHFNWAFQSIEGDCCAVD